VRGVLGAPGFSVAPQLPQKRPPSSAAPHDGHDRIDAIEPPHSRQNFRSPGISAPQCWQVVTPHCLLAHAV